MFLLRFLNNQKRKKKLIFNIFNYLQDSWDAEDEETKKPELKVPEKKTKSKLEQKIAEREVLECILFNFYHLFIVNSCVIILCLMIDILCITYI